MRMHRVLLAMAVCVMCVAWSGAATINVPADYPTIQAAVDAASPGDTVHVAAGTYKGSVAIAKSNITLQGAGAEQTAIEGTTWYAIRIYAGAQDVSIRDASIRGPYYGGVCVHQGAGASLSRVCVRDCGSYGIACVDKGSSLRVDVSTVAANGAGTAGGAGIIVHTQAEADVSDNTIEHNPDGITTWGHARVVATDNTIRDCERYGIDAGGWEGSELIAHGNTIERTGYHAIQVTGTATGQVTGNTVRNAHYGVAVSFSSAATVTGNEISDCYRGVVVWEKATATIEDNIIVDSGAGTPWGAGILVHTEAEADVSDNTIERSPGGITTWGDARVVARHNTIRDCERTGIAAGGWEGSELIAYGNTVERSGIIGIHVTGGASGDLHENEVAASGYSGIQVEAKATGVIAKNFVHECSGPGIVCMGTSPSVRDNTITGNGGNGVSVEPWPGGMFHGDLWQLNPDWAADDMLGDPTITGNTIAGNGGYGIECIDDAPGNASTLAEDNSFPVANARGRVHMAWYGLVKVLQGGSPVAGATVAIADAEGASVLSGSTNAEGLAPASADYHDAYTWPLMCQFRVDNDSLLHECASHTITAQSQDGSARGGCTYSWDGTHKEEGSDIGGRYQIAYVELDAKPIADAGEDRTVEANTTRGANVTLDASSSSDPDGDELAFTWKEGDEAIAGPTTDEQATVFLELGAHEIALEADDGRGDPATDTVTITVVDTTPPELAFEILRDELWPPDHNMVLAAVVTGVTDICDPNPTMVIVVASDEPIDGSGDGTTDPDWEVVQNGTVWEVWLRAERAGSSTGREYCIEATAADASGNSNVQTATITVPHDSGSH